MTGKDLGVASPGRYPYVDTDGDDNDDRIAESGDHLDIVRGDGLVRLVSSGLTALPFYDARFTPGDLDGDGREDFLVYFWRSGTDEGQWFAVSGSVAPGTHPIDEVGVRLPVSRLYSDAGQPALHASVTSYSGGPAADFVVRGPGGEGLVDGSALLEPGPGGSLATFPIAIALPGEPRGQLDLGDAAPALVLAEGSFNTGTEHLWVWRSGRLFELDSLDGAGFLPYEHFRAMQTSVGRLLISETSDRGGGHGEIVWNLDHLCATGTQTPPTEAGAAPADPVAAEPDFTG